MNKEKTKIKMKLKKIVDNLYKSIEIAPDGFILVIGAVAIGYPTNLFSFVVVGVAMAQYNKGIHAYKRTAEHIELYGELDERFVSKMRSTPCYRFGMRCAARRKGKLEEYQDITSKL